MWNLKYRTIQIVRNLFTEPLKTISKDYFNGPLLRSLLCNKKGNLVSKNSIVFNFKRIKIHFMLILILPFDSKRFMRNDVLPFDSSPMQTLLAEQLRGDQNEILSVFLCYKSLSDSAQILKKCFWRSVHTLFPLIDNLLFYNKNVNIHENFILDFQWFYLRIFVI